MTQSTGVTDVPRSPRRRTAFLAAALALAALLLTTCGRDQTPAQAVPELSHRLDEVDAAIVSGDPDEARKAVDALLDEAAQARVDGDLTADQADQILRAATRLLRALPEGGPDAPISDEPSFEPPEIGNEEDEKEGDEAEGKDDDRDDPHGEGDGEGNGPPEGNGPDDGHGN